MTPLDKQLRDDAIVLSLEATIQHELGYLNRLNIGRKGEHWVRRSTNNFLEEGDMEDGVNRAVSRHLQFVSNNTNFAENLKRTKVSEGEFVTGAMSH